MLVSLSLAAFGLTSASGLGAKFTLERAPVYQLPPGHVTIADPSTSQGPVALMVHRIRYLGKMALCVSASDSRGATVQACANYPLGPKSNRNTGNSPVWWSAPYVGACTRRHFQVIVGLVLRSRLTAWLRTPHGLSRVPTAGVPKAFGVSGGLVYALITTAPDSVTLRNAGGRAVYEAPVASLAGVPTVTCAGASSSVITISAEGHVIP